MMMQRACGLATAAGLLSSTIVAAAPPVKSPAPVSAPTLPFAPSKVAERLQVRLKEVGPAPPAVRRNQTALETLSSPANSDDLLRRANVDRKSLERDFAALREQLRSQQSRVDRKRSTSSFVAQWGGALERTRAAAGLRTTARIEAEVSAHECAGPGSKGRECASDPDYVYRLLGANAARNARLVTGGAVVLSELPTPEVQPAVRPTPSSAQDFAAPFPFFVAETRTTEPRIARFQWLNLEAAGAQQVAKNAQVGAWVDVPAAHQRIRATVRAAQTFGGSGFAALGYASIGYTVKVAVLSASSPGAEPICTQQFVYGLYVPVAGYVDREDTRLVELVCEGTRASAGADRLYVGVMAEVWAFAGGLAFANGGLAEGQFGTISVVTSPP